MGDRRRDRLRIVLWLLAAAWMVLILVLSAQPAEASDRTSGRFIHWLLTLLDRSYPALSPSDQLLRVRAWSFSVRKLAHLALFAVLGCLSFAAFSVDLPSRKAFPAALGLGAVRGVLDELQQAFVPGRSCELRDMCIDAAGVFLGAALLLWVVAVIKRKKRK